MVFAQNISFARKNIMYIQICVLRETEEYEKRVAVTPETIKKLRALNCTVHLEKGAGDNAHYTDAMYKQAGAELHDSVTELLTSADCVLTVQKPTMGNVESMKAGSIVVGMLDPYHQDSQSGDALINVASKRGITSFAMELVPRITRAQSMDVLSSQANLAGYKAVLDAAEHYTRAFPMMMTAAGTVAPAKVFVMGAGVAGLQAIATAKRLGAVVSATDVRPAAKEQVQSLGGSFIAVENEEFKEAETAGGYAKEMSDDYKQQQADLVKSHIETQDIVITTALIPGRPAPKLITKDMVESMKPGSVIVDLAAAQGGNCELCKPGSVIDHKGISIIGHMNVPSRLPTDASALYAKNIWNFLQLIIDKDTKDISIDWEDEIIKAMALTKEHDIIHPLFSTEKAA